MTKDSIPPEIPTEEPPSPREQIAGLVSDVRELAEAEWEYARARLSYSHGVVRKTGVLALFSILAMSSAGVALVLGTLLILSSYIGPGAATAVTVVVFVVVSVLLAVLARGTARNLRFTESDRDER
jgi:Putative Actinobacterial Holin-X, holin superfamily III